LHRSLAHITPLLCAALLISCGGQSTSIQPPDRDSQQSSAAQTQADAPGDLTTDLDEWQAWLNDPGEPGVDYDPLSITVKYLETARLPKGISAAVPSVGKRAADCRNAILRQNPGFESLTDAIAARYGLEIDSQVYWGAINVAGFRIGADADGEAILARLRSEFADAIEYASFSMLFKHDSFVPNDPDFIMSSGAGPLYSPLWSLHKIECADAWGITRGDDAVKVAVVDTGVRITHEELQAQVLDPQVEFPDEKLDVANDDNTVEDLDGHGTFIAGQIAAEGNNGRTIVGAAHHCEVMPIKISDGGLASDARIYEGCALGWNLGAKVISLSWGDYHTNPGIESLVDQIWGFGGIFVASAGNDGVTDPHYPSDYANAISVGATDIADARADFSNYSQYVDMAAPGLGIKSCGRDSDSDYGNWTTSAGTSFASPLVAAAAALLWSLDPTLENHEIRNLLENNTAPTTGFTQGTVGRLDIAAALMEVTPIHMTPPRPTRLIHSGTLNLTLEVIGDPDRIDCYLNSFLVESREHGPWTFTIDTSSINFGIANVEFVGVLGQLESKEQLRLIVDNSTGNFPITESFDGAGRDLLPMDVKTYHPNLLSSIKSIESGWTADDVASGGAGAWSDLSTGAYDGPTCKYFGAGDQTYGGFEVDALVSRRIDLFAEDQPTMVFYQRYNIEDGGGQADRALVYISDDDGLSFVPAELNGGGQALFSGYQPTWARVEIDLSAYSGDQIHIVLLMESDEETSGENTEQPAGWWVDKFTIAMEYAEDIPSIEGVSVADYSVLGSVPQQLQLGASVLNPDNVARVRFALDFQPLGSVDLYDVTVSDDAAPFQVLLDVPGDQHNQLAHLLVYYYDSSEVPGPPKTVPVYLFNQLGDTNNDGIVNDDDLLGFSGMVGRTSEDTGYVPFFDTNLDGVITEHDAAAIGYYYGDTM